MNITVSAYNRPDYLRQTLDALSRCDGVADCRVVVMLDRCEETEAQAAIAAEHGFAVERYGERIGCNRAILYAMVFGFERMGSDFHVHLEDDTVPTRDALRWFAWARDRFKDDPAVMNVSGYQRISNGFRDQCGLRRWFTPWGWATWRDRWPGLALGWAENDTHSWDVIVNHGLRAGRYEAFPTASRIQNIGADKGTHVPSPEWHAEHHRVAVTADDLGDRTVDEWALTRVDQNADHA